MARKKCLHKTEVFSRVCGYFRPLNVWNRGKRSEFKDRKPYGHGESARSPGGSRDRKLGHSN